MRRYGVVIKLLAAAAVATASAPAAELPLAFCEDIEAKAAAAAEAAYFETRNLLYYKYSDDSKTAALEAAVSRIRANLASRSIEAAEAAVGERIPRAKTIAVVEDFYRRANPDKVPNAAGWIIDYYEGCELCGNQIYGAFDLNRRVDLHAIDATPARWRGDVGSSPLDGASAATSSPRNDLVKNHRCTGHTG